MARKRTDAANLREAQQRLIEDRRAKFLPLVAIAKIPPENADEFLEVVSRYVYAFKAASELDCFQRQRNNWPPRERNFWPTRELPKRGENRTKILLRNIWLAAKKFGGRLTYDKHTERGTLVEVIKFFHMPVMAKRLQTPRIWTVLSPSTLDRLRPR